MTSYRVALGTFLFGVVIFHAGCSGVSNAIKSATKPTWHQEFGWKAEKYFTDEKVIALCHAIEAEDLEEIDRLVAAGADVNAKGKGNMTPLLWAFPDNKPERFNRLLEHGADPNVIVTSDFNTKSFGIAPGDSVTHMAAKSWFHHFKYVMEHGGDPNLVHPKYKETPLFLVIKGSGGQREERIQLLIDKGADLDHMSSLEKTPAMQAVSWGGQYRFALMLLEAGADHTIYRPDQLSRLVHIVVWDQKRMAFAIPEQKKDYAKLVEWLEQHGESIEEARKDAARWTARGKGRSSTKMKQLNDAEIAERLAREQAEKDKAATND
ncbi:MAG: ankyrin repeat domain-containing protein [Planctomycetes bacterium]|nr:ankyrin repeat domain-containing protein [Planctomycetota bacterium]